MAAPDPRGLERPGPAPLDVWYDTAPLRVRTNRSETAIKVFELGAISGKALRRETGFDEDDAPTAAEQAERDRRRREPR
ncbi:hypothetical protein AB0886_27590 [Streptomyces sp. NPDC024062]|uniref:hypothetical protein n=1 Tax=unclassified Streptomyces TaxID=2593676 RepID=UPI003421F4FA